MIKKVITEYWFFALVVMLVVLPWFLKPGYLFFTDFSWGPNLRANWAEPHYLFYKVIHLLSSLFPVSFLQKLFIALTLFMTLVGGRKLIAYFTSNTWVLYIVSLFALFNPFVYDRLLYGQISIVLAYAFLLYMLGSLLEGVDKYKKSQVLLASVSCALALQFSLHSIFFIIPLLIIVALYYYREKISPRVILLRIVTIGFVIVLININWIYGVVTNTSPSERFIRSGITKNDLQAFATTGDTSLEVVKNVFMFSGFWGKEQFRYTDLSDLKSLWGKSFLILLPIIILGLYIGLRSGKYRLLSTCLLLLALLSVFLAVGIKSSLGQKVTYWMFENMPYYKGLRETQKWVAMLALSYIVFLSIGFNYFFSLKFIKERSLAFGAFLIGVVFMQAPLLFWGFGNQAIPREFPLDWKKVDSVVVQRGMGTCENSKILFLPWHLYMSFGFTERIVANPAPFYFECPVLSGTNMEWGGIYNNSTVVESRVVEEWIHTQGDLSVIKNLGVRYIVIAKEVDWRNYLWVTESVELNLIMDYSNIILYEIL